jgi:hypothetical protein
MLTVDLIGYVCLFAFSVDQRPRKREKKMVIALIASPVCLSQMLEGSCKHIHVQFPSQSNPAQPIGEKTSSNSCGFAYFGYIDKRWWSKLERASLDKKKQEMKQQQADTSSKLD